MTSDEPWFPKSSLIDIIRMRGSYGLVGNTGIAGGDAFPYLDRLSASVPQGREAGVYRASIYDPAVTWETSTILNIGTSASFWQGKLRLQFDYFKRVTEDLVLNKPLPSSLGYGSFFSNVASIENTGFDLDIRATHLRKKNFSWSTALVLGAAQNEITSLPDDKDLPLGRTIWKVGGSRFDYWITEWAGVDPITGLPQWWKSVPEVDENGENKKDKESGEVIILRRAKTFNYDSANLLYSRIYAGNSLPKLYGGLTTNLQLHNFSLRVGFSFDLGGIIYAGDYASLTHSMGRVGDQVTRDYIEKGWKRSGEDAELPIITLGASLTSDVSTRYIYNNSYARLREVALSYTVPNKWLKKSNYIQGVNVFISGNNLSTFFLTKKSKRPPVGPRSTSRRLRRICLRELIFCI